MACHIYKNKIKNKLKQSQNFLTKNVHCSTLNGSNKKGFNRSLISF